MVNNGLHLLRQCSVFEMTYTLGFPALSSFLVPRSVNVVVVSAGGIILLNIAMVDNINCVWWRFLCKVFC